VVEILFVAAAVVVTLAAHRNGMIHRPFFIGDFALVRGIDPSNILLLFGCAAVLSLSALLIIENHQRRLPYHFTIIALLCFSLVGYVQFFGMPSPQMTDDLGLTGAEGAGGSSRDENPFQDSENTADDKQAPVAVVVFRDDYEPVNGSYYFRESAYSQFNGTMLDFATRADMDSDLIKNLSNSRSETSQMPDALDERKTVRTTIGTLVAHRSPFGLDSPVAFENKPNPNNLRFKRTYDAQSLVPEFDFNYLLGRETGRADWSADVLQEYLALPDDPRYGQLAQELISGLKPEFSNDPFAKAWAIKTYLDENGIYSLKNDHAYEADPAASFLFGDLTGYCMHFSFAATYLFRSIGIPARVGIGYSVPASNRAGGSSLLIQAINGHAWPEIYFKDIGWVIVDPAPQQTLVDMTTDPQNELQQLLGDMLRDDAAFDSFLDAQKTSFIDLAMLLRVVYGLVAAILIAGYSVKFYRLWIPRRANTRNAHRLSYRAVVDELSAVGVYRRFGESREGFAKRASAVAPSILLLTDEHLKNALGAPKTANSNVAKWSALRKSLHQELTNSISAWRRYWAIVNPFSWLWSK
jgi:transglutaminase-like putative cysteine protease